MPHRQTSDAGRVPAQIALLKRLFSPRAGAGASLSARDASIGSAVRLAAEVVIRASAIVATLIVTRSLGVEGFGAFVLALSFGLMVAELADLGINALTVPLVVRSGRNLGVLLRLKAGMTALVILCGSFVLAPVARWLDVTPLLLALATAHFVGASWIDLIGSALRAKGRRGEEAILLCSFRLLLLVLVLVFPASRGAVGAAFAYAASSAFGVCLAAALLFRDRELPSPQAPPLALREILRLALPLGANGYLAILSTRVEILLLLQTFGSAALVGLWSGALRIIESLLTLPAAIAAGALPALSRDAVSRSRGAAQRTLGAVVWIGTPAAAGLALRAPEILSVLGPGFDAGAPALRILAIALLLCFTNTALFHMLIAAEQTAVIPRLTALRVAVAGLLGLPLIPAFGLVGAALSFTLAELALCAMLAQQCRTLTEVEILRPVRWAGAACAPMVLLLFLAPWPLLWSVLASVVLFGFMALTILARGSEAGGLA